MNKRVAKKHRKLARPKSTAEDTLVALLEALAQEYPSDQTSPGIVVSRLTCGKYYVSVCRYTGSYGQGKTIIAKASHENLREALVMASKGWLGATAARRNLAALVG